MQFKTADKVGLRQRGEGSEAKARRFETRGTGPAEIFRKLLRLISQFSKPPEHDTL